MSMVRHEAWLREGLAKDLQLRQKLSKGIYLSVGAVRQEPSGRTEAATGPLDECRVRVSVRVAKR